MKVVRTVVGMVSGGPVSAACFGTLSWMVVYFNDAGTGMTDNRAWAALAATLAAGLGLLMGLPLGFLIGLLNGRLVVGTVLGFIGGVVLTVVLLTNGQSSPDIFFSDCLFRRFYSGRHVKWVPGFGDYFAVGVR